jgi:hypothetical protein
MILLLNLILIENGLNELLCHHIGSNSFARLRGGGGV